MGGNWNAWSWGNWNNDLKKVRSVFTGWVLSEAVSEEGEIFSELLQQIHDWGQSGIWPEGKTLEMVSEKHIHKLTEADMKLIKDSYAQLWKSLKIKDIRGMEFKKDDFWVVLNIQTNSDKKIIQMRIYQNSSIVPNLSPEAQDFIKKYGKPNSAAPNYSA